MLKIKELQKENQELKRQLEYLRSGEYLNQLKFERNMLEDIVQNGGVSKEDKEFVDMTHRNTELLEQIDKAIEHIKYIKRVYVELYPQQLEEHERELLKILGGDVDDE